jgi:hypothetical protein
MALSEAKYRIPRMAMAVMVLGANGCGDDDGGGGSASPETRVENLAKKACKLAFSCTTGPWAPEEDDQDRNFSTEQECVAQFVRDSKEAVAGISTACRDAYLDYYECYVSAGCPGDTKGKCKASYQRYVDACKDEF